MYRWRGKLSGGGGGTVRGVYVRGENMPGKNVPHSERVISVSVRNVQHVVWLSSVSAALYDTVTVMYDKKNYGDDDDEYVYCTLQTARPTLTTSSTRSTKITAAPLASR